MFFCLYPIAPQWFLVTKCHLFRTSELFFLGRGHMHQGIQVMFPRSSTPSNCFAPSLSWMRSQGAWPAWPWAGCHGGKCWVVKQRLEYTFPVVSHVAIGRNDADRSMIYRWFSQSVSHAWGCCKPVAAYSQAQLRGCVLSKEHAPKQNASWAWRKYAGEGAWNLIFLWSSEARDCYRGMFGPQN